MAFPGWLWIGTPFKFWLWCLNRLATWTGAFYVWKRFRARRAFWMWIVLLNLVSLSGLVLVFFWLHHRASG